MAPPALPGYPFYKFFYIFSGWVFGVLTMLVWHEAANYTIYASLILGCFACVLSWLAAKTHTRSHLKSCFQLWIYQGIAALATCAFAALWLHHFPYYGFYHQSSWTHYLSVSFFISALVLANVLIVLVSTAQQSGKGVSVLPLYQNENLQSRSLSYKNFVFRRSLMLPALMLFFLSLLCCLPSLHYNLMTTFTSAIILIYWVRSSLCYNWLQQGIKRWHFSFLIFMILLLIAVALLSIMINWFIAPIYPTSPINLFTMGADATLVIFWGFAICTTVPLSFFLAPKLLRLSPTAILLSCLFNPVLWVILLFDLEFQGLSALAHLSRHAIMSIAWICLLISGSWLASKTLAKLNTQLMFANNPYRGGPMPRVFVQSHLVFGLLLIACLSIRALFWIQIEFFVCAIWSMVSDSFLIGYFLVYFNKQSKYT